MDLNDLRRDRKAAADKMGAAADALVQIENETPDNADAIAAAQAEFEAAQASFDKLDAQVKRGEAAEQAAATAAAAPAPIVASAAGAVPATPKNAEQRGAEAGIMVGALLYAGGNKDRAVAKLDADGHSGLSAALSTATDAAGGVTLPRPTSQILIDLLRPRVVVRAAGATVHDMPAGTLRNAKLLTGATATYEAENAPIPTSEPTFEPVDESFKKLTSLVPVSNSLLRYSSMSMGMTVRDLLLQGMAQREDLAFIRGDGSGNTPTGILGFKLAAHSQAAVANGAAAVEAALRKMVSDIDDDNVPMTSPGWIMRASVKHFLGGLREGVGGNKIYPSIDDSGTLKGYPIYTTSQIPNNLGSGSDSEIYFVDFAQMMIGDAMDIQISTSTEAAYVDGGTTYSAFQRDQTLMRAISEHDFASAHDEAISYATVTSWQ